MSPTKTQSYLVWITGPGPSDGFFTLNISPAFGPAAVVKQTLYDDEEVLKRTLLLNLPRFLNKEDFVCHCIEVAKLNGICDWREIDIQLDDNAARNLGWQS